MSNYGTAILLFAACWHILGLGCYICILRFFPPHDIRPCDTTRPSRSTLEPFDRKAQPSTFSSLLEAIPDLLLMFAFAPGLLILFIWQRARGKKGALSAPGFDGRIACKGRMVFLFPIDYLWPAAPERGCRVAK